MSRGARVLSSPLTEGKAPGGGTCQVLSPRALLGRPWVEGAQPYGTISSPPGLAGAAGPEKAHELQPASRSACPRWVGP